MSINNTSGNMAQYPLISFLVLGYNQEHYIREAVAGAFAQTYSPLEIILSDDCSQDRTFDIMREMAEAYHGPHQVVLNQNPENLGISGHVSNVLQLALGDLLVAAAGDDVSLPVRTSALYEAWLSRGASAHSVFSNAVIIDGDGKTLGDWFPTPWVMDLSLKDAVFANDIGLLGCAHMFTRQTFDVFGPLHPGSLQEDSAIAFRSLILGKLEYVPLTLVQYRRHGSNLWQTRGDPMFRDMARRRRWLKGEVATLEAKMSDLATGLKLGLVKTADGEVFIAKIRHNLEDTRFELELAEAGVVGRVARGIHALSCRQHSLIKVADLFIDSFQHRTVSRFWRSLRKRFPGERIGAKR